MSVYRILAVLSFLGILIPLELRASCRAQYPDCVQTCMFTGGASQCRAQCYQRHCGVAQDPAQDYFIPTVGMPDVPQAISPLFFYYGPFFPGPDFQYLIQLQKDLRAQLDEAKRFYEMTKELGNPMLSALALTAWQEADWRMNAFAGLYGRFLEG